MNKNSPQTAKYILPCAAVLLAVALLGRAVSYFYSITATDIAYAEVVPSVLSSLSDIIFALRISLGYAIIANGVFRFGNRGGLHSLAAVAGVTAFDYALRLIIDLAGGVILGQEALAVAWVALQLIYELLFCTAAYLISRSVCKKRTSEASIPERHRRFTPRRAVRLSVIVYALSRIAAELAYLIDFLITYSDITPGEVGSIISAFVGIIITFALIPIALYELYRGALEA